MSERERESVRASECVSVRERVRERACVCECEREKERACVCVREREKERERECESVCVCVHSPSLVVLLDVSVSQQVYLLDRVLVRVLDRVLCRPGHDGIAVAVCVCVSSHAALGCSGQEEEEPPGASYSPLKPD